MSPLKRIENQIKQHEKDLQALEAKQRETEIEIREASFAISALKKAVKHFPKEDIDGDPARSLRVGGQVHRIYIILKEHGTPMHIKEILEKLDKDTDAKTQQATGSQLNSYVRQGKIFSRDTPNTFGLKEWKVSTNNSLTSPEDVQPALLLADEGGTANPH